MKKILVATRVDEPTHSALKCLAKEQERTVSFLVKKAIEAYVQTDRASMKKGEA